jgi:ribosomal protein S18 acetylase RimI-like enzyme
VTIRRATEKDFPALLSLINEFAVFQKTPEKVSITLEQMKVDQDHFQCFVAEADSKEIVAFASFFFAYYSWSGKALYLDDLYVTEAFRNQGSGRRLLETIINLAKESNCKKVRWQVSKWNSNAISFYKKLGAAIEEIEINCDYYLDSN